VGVVWLACVSVAVLDTLCDALLVLLALSVTVCLVEVVSELTGAAALIVVVGVAILLGAALGGLLD
jgi:hypothetical protein